MIDRMRDIAENFNQVSDDSLLWRTIQIVLECKESYAKKMARSHCNSLSFYGCLFAQGFINISYQEFFEKGYEQKVWTKKGKIPNIQDNGFINDKNLLCKELGVDYDYTEHMIKDFNELANCKEGKAYQIRISTGILSKHFLMAAVKNKVLNIYDTWDKKYIDVDAYKKVNKKNFEVLMEV